MSLVVKLEDDLGERSDWVMLHSVIPSRDEKEYPLLSGIDPYGKTVFNHLQMERFLEEWDRVRDRAKDESQQASLAARARNGAGLQRGPRLVFQVRRELENDSAPHALFRQTSQCFPKQNFKCSRRSSRS